MEVDEREIEDVARKRLESTIADVAGLSPAVRIEQAVAEGYRPGSSATWPPELASSWSVPSATARSLASRSDR